MMEIAFGPVIVACARQSVIFGLVFALAMPLIEARVCGLRYRGALRQIGLGLAGGGTFGLAHLVLVCANDGFPPRIIQSTGVALLLLALTGFAIVARSARARAKA